MLLIRGMEGNGDEALNRVYRDAGGRTAIVWEIPRAGHTGGISAAPAEYERRVIGSSTARCAWVGRAQRQVPVAVATAM